MYSFPRYTWNGLILQFGSTARREEFKKSDRYYDFMLLTYGDDDVWDLTHTYKEPLDFDKIYEGSKHYGLVLRKREVVWTNFPELMPEHKTCPKCKSKKIEYVGLGVGSSQVELICPKCV